MISSHSQTLVIQIDANIVFKAAKRAFLHFGFEPDRTPAGWEVKTPWSKRSQGEIVSVSLERLGPKTSVTIKSHCIDISQLLDWGKNKQNVDQLFNQLSIELGVT